MSLRMKRQSKKAKMFGVDNGVPGVGAYSHADVKDIGNTRSKFQAWKSPTRKTDWYVPKGRVATEFDLNLDKHSIQSRLSTTPIRLKTTMGSRVPRSPVCADSRRPTEKLSFQTFMVEEPYSARPNTADLGPGVYKHESRKDIGKDSRRLQQWTAPTRDTEWWHRKTDAPSDLYSCDLSLHPSRKICGGRDSSLWPLPEDEDGMVLTNNPYEYILDQSRASSRTGLRSRGSMSGGGQQRRPKSSAF